GSALPNTYYLKLEGYPATLRMLRGVRKFTALFAGPPGATLVPIALLLSWRRDAKVLMLAALFACEAAYSIYVGGDAWEWYGGANRYIAIAIPLFMILLATALDMIVNRVAAWAHTRASHRTTIESGWLFAVLATFSIVLVNADNRMGQNQLARLV